MSLGKKRLVIVIRQEEVGDVSLGKKRLVSVIRLYQLSWTCTEISLISALGKTKNGCSSCGSLFFFRELHKVLLNQ